MPAKKNPHTVGQSITLKGYDFERQGTVVDTKLATVTLVEFKTPEGDTRRMLISNDLLRKFES